MDASDRSNINAGSRLQVVAVQPGGSAEHAGVQKGDIVTHVMGRSTEGMTPDDCASQIRGPVGTEVKITTERLGMLSLRRQLPQTTDAGKPQAGIGLRLFRTPRGRSPLRAMMIWTTAAPSTLTKI